MRTPSILTASYRPAMTSPARRRRFRYSLGMILGLAVGVLTPDQGSAGGSAHIPLTKGLMFVTAVHSSASGDYESFTTIDDVSSQSFKVTAVDDERGSRHVVTRVITTADALNAHKRQVAYPENGQQDWPGTTGPEVSLAVLNELKTRGSTEYTDVQAGSVMGLFSMTMQWSGTVKRVEANDVPVSVVVNDVPTQLPTVHAKGTLSGQLGQKTYECYILDDSDFPLVLLHKETGSSGEGGRIVKISFRSQTSTQSVERRLATSGRAAVYGIYFDFDSATVRDQSTPALQQIAGALLKNPTWKLTIEGHTDNLGGAAYNMDLSVRRANAVKAALVGRYHIDAGRLTTVGYGATRPKGSNDTLEGRAENRRVELVRH